MAKDLKPFTYEQRIKIYRKALVLFKKREKDRTEGYCAGMCDTIYQAIRNLDYGLNDTTRRVPLDCIDQIELKKFWPEFASFKPKDTWKKSRAYWYTRDIKKGGAKHRIRILQALSDGTVKK